MARFRIKLKGIVKYEDKYLLVKKWYDDRITDPYQWEFLDIDLGYGSNPDEAILEFVSASTNLHIEGSKILYTWNYTVGENEYVGLAYLCNTPDDTVFLSEELNDYAWVSKSELADYIENKNILSDVMKGLERDNESLN